MREIGTGYSLAEDYQEALYDLETAKRKLDSVGIRAFYWTGDNPFDYEGELKAAQAAYDAAKAKVDELRLRYHGGDPVFSKKSGMTARLREINGY